MVNMSIPYRGPDGMSQQLLSELQTRFGARAQNKGYVTGYMASAQAGETGGHFADRYGITHAIDIGVDIESDGTGLRPQDALVVAEHLRKLGAGGKHPFSRCGYLIHDMSTTTTPAPRIAGFHTAWQWQVYTGRSPHSDHIHVTTGGDQVWGGEPQLAPSVYDSRQSWGIGGAVTDTGWAMRPAPEMYPQTQGYRENATSFNRGAFHGAIDIGVPPGTPLVAPEDGVVVFDGWSWDLPGGPNDWHLRWYLIKPARGDTRTGGGIITIIRNAAGSHWGIAHAGRSYFNVGDRIRKGQVIQESGNTGSSTGPHTHINLWPARPSWGNGAFGAIDPAPYIRERYAPLTYVSWQGAPTEGVGATTKKKDWFDMATEADLRRVVREEIAKNNAAAAQAVMRYRVNNAGKHPVTGEELTGFTTQENELRHAYLHALRRKNTFETVKAIADAVRPSTLLAVFRPTTKEDA